MLKNEYPPSFPLRLMHKDMRLALELARQKGVELPAAAASYATYSAVKDASKEDAGLFSRGAFLEQGASKAES